jgi:hypothetical protein
MSRERAALDPAIDRILGNTKMFGDGIDGDPGFGFRHQANLHVLHAFRRAVSFGLSSASNRCIVPRQPQGFNDKVDENRLKPFSYDSYC